MRVRSMMIFKRTVAVMLAVLASVCAVSCGENSVQVEYTSESGEISFSTSDITETASFFGTEIDGVSVEIIAVLSSDGTVRLAMNTCQVCNGSPYAYFVQSGDEFICQNCGNSFLIDEIGLSGNGCNPVPITSESYTESDGIITVFAEFLSENAYRFKNWKNF